jgi:cytochrome c5
MRIWAFFAVGLVCATLAQADSTEVPQSVLDGFVTFERLPEPSDPDLAQGRMVYGDTCQNCHGGNKATGAPKVTSTKAWARRIEQDMDVLIAHAINGFVGPKYTQMPARGANPDLTDDEVASAVVFMVWISGGAEMAQTYITEQRD